MLPFIANVEVPPDVEPPAYHQAAVPGEMTPAHLIAHHANTQHASISELNLPGYGDPHMVTVRLPKRIPEQCVYQSADTYDLNPLILLAVLKVESDGRTGIVSRNTDDTYDLGPAQLNTKYWAKEFITVYNISREALINDMCQAIRAMAFVLRTEINRAAGDVIRGVGNYHSRTPEKHDIYVGKFLKAYAEMVRKGQF